MNDFSFDQLGFKIDGQDSYLISGEFHYFRVPREDWKRRMKLFREAGGNCIATYVPWVIHEPTEGDIRFGDIDARDLCGFLRMAQEMGLKVILRPGPYQYSEIYYAGLPAWLSRDYPETLAVDIHGKRIHRHSISYVHPVFLEKARSYYRAVADQIRPYMMENGGPICMIQLDNELAGIHTWYGSLDYNPTSMGFYRPDGRYPCWLRQKYKTIGNLNTAYGTDYLLFEYVLPIAGGDRSSAAICRQIRDYSAFYRFVMAEYLSTLAAWLREDGLRCIVCHNSASPGMNCLFAEATAKLGRQETFLLASDHYYTLNQSWAQNNPTPQYALRILMSCDTLRMMDMPPTVMELPGGSLSDTPPILANDLLACYMSNLALGVKGVNYYIFTGGPNFPSTGETCDIYDYHAPVHADGSINEQGYSAVKEFGSFMHSHAWLQRAHRAASVQVGYEWNTLQCEDFDCTSLPCGAARIKDFLEKGILYSLMCSSYSPEMTLLTSRLDIDKPLIVPSPSAMSAEAQHALEDFIRRGGRALMLPVLPETDFDYQPLEILASMFKNAGFSGSQDIGPAIEVKGVGRVFGITCLSICEKLPDGAQIIATDVAGEKIIGFEMGYGQGKILWFGGVWELLTFPQVRMLEEFIRLLGGQRCVESSNRNIFCSLWTDEQNRRQLFAMNLYSSPQSTQIHVFAGGEREIGRIDLKPMEVRAIDL